MYMLITRPIATLVVGVRFPDQTHGIIRCKKLALYITDCVSLCLSDETLKAVGPFYLVATLGEANKIPPVCTGNV